MHETSALRSKRSSVTDLLNGLRQTTLPRGMRVETRVQYRDTSTSKKKGPSSNWTGPSVISLTMSYFHTGIRTIIGAEAFHCPVRDGKEWDHLAMVIRLDLSSIGKKQIDQFIDSNQQIAVTGITR